MSALTSTGSFLLQMFIGAVPGILNATKYARKIMKEKNQEKAEAFKMSQQIDTTDLSERLYSDIRRMSRGSIIMEVVFTSTAVRSAKFIKYALYYLIDDSAKRITIDEIDQKFVNAVAEYCGAPKIYPNMDSLDLTEFDSTYANHKFNKAYLIDLSDLQMKVSNPEFIKLMKAKAGRSLILDTGLNTLPGTVSGIRATIDNDGMIHPIFFKPTENDSQKFMKRQSAAITDKVFNTFENAFYNLFNNDDKYYYSTDEHGCYTLNIIRQNAYNAIDTYIIDDGSLLGGNNVSILATFALPDNTQDHIFVSTNIEDKSLIKKILSNPFYVMTKEETLAAMHMMFNNAKIYHYIDFTNTDWMNSLSYSDYTTLERKLGQVIQAINDVRIRFNSFNGVNNFVLVSDKFCSSKLSYDNTTSKNIEEGLVITVIDNNLNIKRSDGSVKNYNLV